MLASTDPELFGIFDGRPEVHHSDSNTHSEGSWRAELLLCAKILLVVLGEAKINDCKMSANARRLCLSVHRLISHDRWTNGRPEKRISQADTRISSRCTCVLLDAFEPHERSILSIRSLPWLSAPSRAVSDSPRKPNGQLPPTAIPVPHPDGAPTLGFDGVGFGGCSYTYTRTRGAVLPIAAAARGTLEGAHSYVHRCTCTSYHHASSLMCSQAPRPSFPPSPSRSLEMGCGASKEVTAMSVPPLHETASIYLAHLRIADAEDAPDRRSFIGSIIEALEKSDDAVHVQACCEALAALNTQLKVHIGELDATSAHKAMRKGLMNMQSTSHDKLIACLCTRTKAQLMRTAAEYHKLYGGQDLRAAVKGFASSDYGRLVYHALAEQSEYIADMLDVVSTTPGNEALLVQIIVSATPEELTAGVAAWKARTGLMLGGGLDSHITAGPGCWLEHNELLSNLLMEVVGGSRDAPDAPVDEAKADEQLATLQADWCTGSALPTTVFDFFTTNNQAQNARMASLYEKATGVSLRKAFSDALSGLSTEHGGGDGGGGMNNDDLLSIGMPNQQADMDNDDDLSRDGADSEDEQGCPPPVNVETFLLCFQGLSDVPERFLATQLHAALHDSDDSDDPRERLVRILSGLEGARLANVVSAYETKYEVPLRSDLTRKLSGHFLKAAVAWCTTHADPSGGYEEETATPSELAGDLASLKALLTRALQEYGALVNSCSKLDLTRVVDACNGWGTDDTEFIRVISTRSKGYLARLSRDHRDTYGGQDLGALIASETSLSGWFSQLATFIVLSPARSDLRLLDLAFSDNDHDALLEFLCARPPWRMKRAKATWEGHHDASLVDKLFDTLTGPIQRIALDCLKNRMKVDESAEMSFEEAQKLAQKLADAPAGRGFGVQMLFLDTMANLNSQQMHVLKGAYEASHLNAANQGKMNNFERQIEFELMIINRFGLDSEMTTALLAMLIEPEEFFARKLFSCLQKTGFRQHHQVVKDRDRTVSRILGCADKDEVAAIAAAYEKFGKGSKRAPFGYVLDSHAAPMTLLETLKSKCTGKYKRLAMAWVSNPDCLAQPPDPIMTPEEIEIEIEAWDMRVGDEADNSFGGACRRESECAITLAHHCLAYLCRVADTASLFSTHRARRQARQVRNARIGCDGEERCRL